MSDIDTTASARPFTPSKPPPQTPIEQAIGVCADYRRGAVGNRAATAIASTRERITIERRPIERYQLDAGEWRVEVSPDFVIADEATRVVVADVLQRVRSVYDRRRSIENNLEHVVMIVTAVADAIVELRRTDPVFVAQALIDMDPEHRDRVLVLYDAIKLGGG